MSNSRTKNVFLNVLFGYGAQLGMLLLSFIGRKIFLDFLSIDYLGINGLFSNVLTILSLPELGLDSAVVYFLYKPAATGDKRQISALLTYFRKIYYALALAIFVIGLALIPFLKFIIQSELPQASLIIYYVLFLTNTVISYLVAHKVALLLAHQQQRIQKTVMLVSNIALQVIHIIVLVLWQNYYLYIAATILGTLINNILLSRICNKLYPAENIKDDTLVDKKSIITKVKSTFVYKIGTVLINSTTNILISTLVSTAAVGLYSNYLTVINAALAFLAIITTSLISSIGNLASFGDKEKQYDYFNVLILFYHFVSAVGAMGFYFVLDDFVVLWIGEQYLLSREVMAAIALNFYLTNLITPIWMYREANGLFEKVKYLMLIMAILNIALSVIFGKIWGVAGIIFALVVSRALTCLWYEPNVLFKNVFGKSTRFYWQKEFKYFVLSAISFALIFVSVAAIGGGIFGIVAKAAIVVAVSTAVFALGCIKSPELKKVKGILLRR